MNTRTGGQSQVKAQTAFAKALTVHQAVYERSGGWIGHRVLGVPCLLLRTTGRRTGQRRTSSLTYGRDGADYLVVPSNGGARRTSAWWHNLGATPEAEVQVGRSRRRVTARSVWPEDDDYQRLWKIVNKANAGRYQRYAEQTSRRFPVVVLTPMP